MGRKFVKKKNKTPFFLIGPEFYNIFLVQRSKYIEKATLNATASF